MTDKPDLDAIEARCNAATEGPWDDKGGVLWIKRRSDGQFIAGAGIPRDADAIFCAHARQDIPALIAEVRRLRERTERLESDNFDLEELLGISEGQVNSLKEERVQHHEAQNAG